MSQRFETIANHIAYATTDTLLPSNNRFLSQNESYFLSNRSWSIIGQVPATGDITTIVAPPITDSRVHGHSGQWELHVKMTTTTMTYGCGCVTVCATISLRFAMIAEYWPF